MTWTASGSEFLVNSTTSGNQELSSVAALSSGGYLVTWTDYSASSGDTSQLAIRAQAYDSSSNVIGDEFLVNTTTSKDQYDSYVLGLSNGGFVVAWTDLSLSSDDTSATAIRAQVFDSSFSKVGSEFLVNTSTSSEQTSSSLAALNSGKFVAVWSDGSNSGSDNSLGAVRGQLFDGTGSKIGSEFLVNTTTLRGQDEPSTASSGSGFIVAFTDNSRSTDDPSAGAIRAQRFNLDGSKNGSEFLVNTTTTGDQRKPSVDILTNGSFVVTWSTEGADSFRDIRGQMFDSSGSKIGSEFSVNTTTNYDQYDSRVIALSGGGFVVFWTDREGGGSDQSGFSVRGQHYSGTGE